MTPKHWPLFPDCMKKPTSPKHSAPLYLGIEGGGTRTTALLVDAADRVLYEASFDAGNLKLLSDRELQWRLREIATRLPCPVTALGAIAIGLAGTRTDPDRDRIRRGASRIFPKVPCLATNDLETALAAAPEKPGMAARVLVLSGTGSCCYGSTPEGRTAKVGGRGHIIGDRGSATEIGLKALRALVAQADRSGTWPKLGTLILDALALNVPDDLIDWSIQADKTDMASLAIPVFRAAAQRDPLARGILAEAAEALATDAAACAGHLTEASQPVHFILNGGMLLNNPAFAKDVTRRLRQKWPGARVEALTRPSVWGAVALAKSQPPRLTSPGKTGPPSALAPLTALLDSPTEHRNPRSTKLDTMPLGKAVNLMLEEESQVPHAIAQERATMHLDTVCTMVDVDKVVMYPNVAHTLRAITVTMGEKGSDMSDLTLSVSDYEPFLVAAAKAMQIDSLHQIDTGLDPVTAEREQWDDANNFLALAPGVLVGYERNTVTNSMLREHGIEVANVAELLADPERSDGSARLATIPGMVPGLYDRPSGCLFAPRCAYAVDSCRAQRPPLRAWQDGNVRCHYPLGESVKPTSATEEAS